MLQLSLALLKYHPLNIDTLLQMIHNKNYIINVIGESSIPDIIFISISIYQNITNNYTDTNLLYKFYLHIDETSYNVLKYIIPKHSNPNITYEWTDFNSIIYWSRR